MQSVYFVKPVLCHYCKFFYFFVIIVVSDFKKLSTFILKKKVACKMTNLYL